GRDSGSTQSVPRPSGHTGHRAAKPGGEDDRGRGAMSDPDELDHSPEVSDPGRRAPESIWQRPAGGDGESAAESQRDRMPGDRPATEANPTEANATEANATEHDTIEGNVTEPAWPWPSPRPSGWDPESSVPRPPWAPPPGPRPEWAAPSSWPP